MLKVRYIVFLGLVLTLSNCAHKTMIKKKIIIKTDPLTAPRKSNKQDRPHVTVWVHGTKAMGTISDHIHATHQTGLIHYSTLPAKYRLKGVIETLSKTDPERYPLEHFHVFGWSGKLCFNVRKEEAKKLHEALSLLTKSYENSYGVKPHITLITHSHGGNVALNMAHANAVAPTKLTIDQAIILACPVQHETKELVADSMFKKIYSLYSTLDAMQVLDPQGLYKTEKNKKRHLEFSERKFPLAANLRQAKLTVNNHGIAHIGFILCSFSKMLPQIIDEIEQWEAEEPSREGQERIIGITIKS